MARSRGRSRGPSLPALGGTLGSLVRSTLAQAGAVKDVLERGAREGRQRLDDVRRERRRDQALARLGETVLEALRAGEAPELLDRADVADALADVEELERGQERDRDRRDEAWVAPPRRERYDRDDDGTVSSAGWRSSRSLADEDGTVSSAGWRPPPRPRADEGSPQESGRSTRRPAEEPGARFQERRGDDRGERVERGERGAPADRGERVERVDRGERMERVERAPEKRRPGGIQFDQDDDDLADYMHPDDLAPHPTKGS